MHPTPNRTARTVRTVAFGAAMIVLGSVTGAYASHQFADVPASSPFHASVDHVARAGVTLGFLDGTYRPADAVTRGQMAGFLDRGLGRVAYDEGERTDVVLADGQVVVTDVRIRSGASGGEGGFVVLTATFDVSPDGVTVADSHRTIWKLRDATDDTEGPSVYLPWTNDDVGGALSWVVPIGPGQTKRFELVGSVNSSPAPPFVLTGRLAAQYTPFGWNGGGALDSDIVIGGG